MLVICIHLYISVYFLAKQTNIKRRHGQGGDPWREKGDIKGHGFCEIVVNFSTEGQLS